jgi:hypothetical protein
LATIHEKPRLGGVFRFIPQNQKRMPKET